MEDKSLSLLQKTEGHILDDQDLVLTLQQSKGMSEEISVRIAQAELTEKRLSQARQKYLPVSTQHKPDDDACISDDNITISTGRTTMF
jgi:dynein heavy chain